MVNPPTPVELRRRRGNPSKRPLPSVEETGTILPASEGLPPEPYRELGENGRAWWDAVLTAGRSWLAVTDLELVLQVAEQIDEQQALRHRVVKQRYRRDGWRDRGQLRALDEQIRKGLSDLGFSPTARTRLGLAQVKAASIVSTTEEKMAQRRGKLFDGEAPVEVPAERPSSPALPRKSWSKAKVVAWYEANSVEIPEGATKAKLLELAGVAA